ncbi:nuclear transport factor 2 family protein [Granulicoccus phenolivorans]|uniref:nuclear transport factor 2 family protein n=1 Tax=Granulicoccus phenolivorans TaxID=266854 RepID=UPI00040DDD3C|nr:nuclear transport factor 2 family protein [Granulicoccus phenolivorans]
MAEPSRGDDPIRIPTDAVTALTIPDPAGLADREAIRSLAIVYARAVDDHDPETVAGLFTEDATFDNMGRVARGRDQVLAQLTASMRGFRMMLHTPDTHVIELNGAGAARGWATGHAELVTRRTTVLAAYRYLDGYARVGKRWCFTARTVRFMYAIPTEDYPSAMSRVDRIRFPRSEPGSAAYPEQLGTWQALHPETR